MAKKDNAGAKEASDRFEIEQHLRLAFENNVAGIIITDLNSHILDVNSSFCNMLGYTRDELVSSDLKKYTPAEDRSITLRVNKKLLREGLEQVIYNKRYQHRDGSLVWFEISKSVGRNQNG